MYRYRQSILWLVLRCQWNSHEAEKKRSAKKIEAIFFTLSNITKAIAVQQRENKLFGILSPIVDIVNALFSFVLCLLWCLRITPFSMNIIELYLFVFFLRFFSGFVIKFRHFLFVSVLKQTKKHVHVHYSSRYRFIHGLPI